MKNTIRLFLVAAFAFAAMSLSAQQPALKLGHIESQKLLQAMPEWAAAQTKFEAQQSEVEKELTSQKESFQKMLAEYSEKSKTYSDVIRAAKEQELQDMQQRIQLFQERAEAELNKAQRALTQPIFDKMTNAIKEVGKENGFTYIFDVNAGGVVYTAENSTDILPLVKKKLGIQ